MPRESSDIDMDEEDERVGKNKRFSSLVGKGIENLRPEFKDKAKAKAERIDETIREKENKVREKVSKGKFVAGKTKDTIGKTGQFFKRKPKEKRTGNFRQNLKANFNEKLAKLGTRFRTTDFTLVQKSTGEFFLQPKFIRKDFFDVPRTSQWMAAFLLPIVILVSLAIIEAVQLALEGILLNGGDLGNQLPVFKFFSTFIGLALFCLGAWAWFLWVRTGGFKLFDF